VGKWEKKIRVRVRVCNRLCVEKPWLCTVMTCLCAVKTMCKPMLESECAPHAAAATAPNQDRLRSRPSSSLLGAPGSPPNILDTHILPL